MVVGIFEREIGELKTIDWANKKKKEKGRENNWNCARVAFERQEKNVSETNCKGLSLPLFPFLRILNPSITQRITFCVWKARVSIRLHWGKSGPCLSV